MKKILQFSLIIFALFLFFEQDLYGQRRGKKKRSSDVDEYFDDGGSLKTRLWYGGGFNLNFGGSNIESQFLIGISPMVGYKVFEELSIGPRLFVDYTFYSNEIIGDNANLWSYGVGAFTRYKVFQSIFAHIEYEFQDEGFPAFRGNTIEEIRRTRNNFYLGGGYNSSGGGSLWGFEIYLLYNVNIPEDSIDNPFVLRFGVTYNF